MLVKISDLFFSVRSVEIINMININTKVHLLMLWDTGNHLHMQDMTSIMGLPTYNVHGSGLLAHTYLYPPLLYVSRLAPTTSAKG